MHDQRNHREISPGKLHCGGTLNPIGVDIYTICHKKYGGHILVSEEDDLVKLFASYFPRKGKTPLTHCRSSKYDAGQEIRIGPP